MLRFEIIANNCDESVAESLQTYPIKGKRSVGQVLKGDTCVPALLFSVGTSRSLSFSFEKKILS